MSVTFRSGSESYEQLTPDGELGETGLNEHFNDNRATPSDDSDIYSQVDFHRDERERELLKGGDFANKLTGKYFSLSIYHLNKIIYYYLLTYFRLGKGHIQYPS